MRVFVAALTLFWGRFEGGVFHRQFEIRRLVAIDAGHGAMSSQERVRRRRVIEASDVSPCSRGMAGFALERRPIRPGFCHPLRKLPLVGIEMTTRACQISEVKRNRLGGSGGLSGLVTIRTRYGEVTAHKGKSYRVVLGQAEVGGDKSFDRMAALASVVVWRADELRLMNDLVTVVAPRELDFVLRALPHRWMTPGTGNLGVLALQRVVCGRMLCDTEFRLLEIIYRVTGLASSTILSGAKLALMRVLVTIRAPLVGQRSGEV